MARSKKVVVVSGSVDPALVTVTRRESLPLEELLGAYVQVSKDGGNIRDLAYKLGRPIGSIVQRVNVLRKIYSAQHGKALPKLARAPGGGRHASNVQLPDFDDLLGNLNALE